mmetsp:Transcript_3019/g.3407  ORF Transcript_3019/g.3407 Transcript_3019/m.3407 type:complete len:568 (-) Transcript_3019:450-2153(-)
MSGKRVLPRLRTYLGTKQLTVTKPIRLEQKVYNGISRKSAFGSWRDGSTPPTGNNSILRSYFSTSAKEDSKGTNTSDKQTRSEDSNDESKPQGDPKSNDGTVGGFFAELKEGFREEFGKNEELNKSFKEVKSAFSFKRDKEEKDASGGDSETSSDSEKKSGMFSGFTKNLGGAGDGIGSATERITSKLPENFGNDDKTWGDALRAVFGLKPKNSPGKKGKKKEKKEWFEAVDEESGKTYYYTAEGETVWEKPDELKSAEEMAQTWAEHKGEPEESFLEKQIKEKAEKIAELEKEFDLAMGESDMARVKELNKEKSKLRKEIEKLSAQANTTAVTVVEEKKGAWDQFSESLKDTPLMQHLFGVGAKVGESSAARKAREAAEDAREAWETSQNPWVYRAYSAYESVFAESEMGEVIREIRKLDPDFSFEDMIEEMEEEVVPAVVGAYLRADVEATERWCAEAAAAAIKASIEQRKAAGRKMDTNILSIDHMEVFAAKNIDKVGPVVFIQFMVQQIDCMYDMNGKVVDGADDKVAAVFYMISVQREYDEEEAELKWGVKELAIIGTQPYT